MIVFEPELWGVSPLVPAGKAPSKIFGGSPADGKAAPGSAAANAKSGLKLWDGGSFDFHDILDVINPLQHLPVVSTIYRAESGDQIGAIPRILGSMLFGGGPVGAVIGAASAIFNIVVEHETGKDLGTHIYTALFGNKDAKPRTTQVAAPKATAPATSTAGVAASAGAAAAATSQSTASQSAAPGAKKIEPRTHAALQAFVTGLIKNSPGAAAAAANSAAIKNAVRVNGTAGPAAKKGDVASQFRRSTWYQQNQAALRAQANELAATKAAQAAAAAKSASKASEKTAAGAASGAPAILQLFTTPAAGAKAAKNAGAAAGAAKSGERGLAANAAAAARSRAVPGPWVAGEIANGLAKYDAMIKARKAAGATINQKN